MIKKLAIGAFTLLPAIYSCQSHTDAEVDIAVCCITDFHAAFVADENRDLYGVGSLLHTLDSLKAVYPHHIVISAGDNFGGSYFYKVTNGATMPIFLEEADIHISALGNHEFDEGQEKLAQKWSAQNNNVPCSITYLSANLRDTLGRIPHFAKAYAINEIKLSDTKSFTLSLIGISTASTPQQTSLKHVKDLHFDAEYKSAIDSLISTPEYSNIAPSIDACFMVGHLGAEWKNSKPEWKDVSTSQLLDIDKKSVDGIFTGHTHDTLTAYINKDKLPIIQAGCNGAYIGVMKIKFDTIRNVITSITPELCAVRNTPNTSYRTQQMIEALLDTTYVGGRPLNEQLCTIKTEMPHNRSLCYGFSEVADIVCASYAAAYTSKSSEKIPVIGMSHYGSIRASLYPGILSVLKVGEILPFANNLRAYRYSGKELKELAAFGLNNKKFGWLQTHAFTFECTVTAENLNVNKVYHTTSNGTTKEIKDTDECIIVVDDYMTTGGDGYAPSFFPKRKEVRITLPTTTTAFFNYLKEIASFESNPERMKKIFIDGNACRTLEEISNLTSKQQ